MAIPVTCACGRSLRARDEFAGRKVRCPDCKAVLEVPDPNAEKDPEDEILNVLLADDPPAAAKSREAVRAEPAPSPREALSPAPRPALPPPAPSRSVRRKDPDVRRKAPRVAFEEGWFGSVNSGAVGGILMMVIAAVWFFLGLAAGRIFFYPPILFVVGFVSLVKGLTGGGD